jgi:MFS family permease
VLSSLQGVGAIAGGVTAARVMRRIGDVKLVGLGMGVFAVGEQSFVSHSLPLVLAGIALAGAGIAWLFVGYITAIQVRTPLRLQGRVLSASDTLVNTPQTISIALGALLTTLIDYRILVVVMAVVTAAAGSYLLSRRAIVSEEHAEDPVLAA